MMLRRRVALTSVLIAIPAALLLTVVVDRVRAADQQLALERVVRSQVNEQVRERCESDPTWFLTGPLDGRPRGGVFVETSPDQLPPRPKSIPQAFELFAYDEAFVGSSSASARFPPDFRRSLRTTPDPVFAPYDTSQGTGIQMALTTGWIGGPCMYFLGRMEPMPNQWRQRAMTFTAGFALSFIVSWLVMVPTVHRVRRLASDAHQAVDANYSAIGPDKLKDELSSLTFIYNDAANELQLRKARIDDQDASLKRFVQATEEHVAQPLVSLEKGLGVLATSKKSLVAEDVGALLRQAHDLAAQVDNLTAAARLRMLGQSPATSPVDLKALVARVVARHAPLAETADVALTLALPPGNVTVAGDEVLLERAIANVVDNAIRYNRSGGDVRVALESAANEQRFHLRISDTGRGVTEEEFRGLTAIRRFRGDEGRNRRPGAPGLGLSIAREVADRFKMQLELTRPGSAGFSVEFSGAA